MNFIIGLIGVVIGFLITWKTDWILENFGHLEWAEEKLGAGGTRLFWKLFGIVVIFFSIGQMFGLWHQTIINLLTPLFSSLKT